MLKFLLMILMTLIMKMKLTKSMMAILMIMFNLSLQGTSIQKISYIFMGDLISFWNSNLSLWIVYSMMFMTTTNQNFNSKILLTTMLIFVSIFYTWNFMIFYIIFESSMIMMLIMITSWSYQPERTEALMFMILMTIMFSLPFMIIMMYKYKSLNFWFIKIDLSVWSYLSFMFIFMMKMPSYFIHFWLPKVHVEAPVQGSMILAAIMLKMGCYGMMRMMMMMIKFKMINLIISTTMMWSMVILSMSCFIQTDIKTLIAYSSVVHMMLVLLTIMTNKNKSVFGSIITMMSHGLCAAALFFMSNIFYSNSKSRSILINKGMAQIIPMMMLMWFAGCMSNTPMPPFISIIGEIISFKMILNSTNMMTMIFMMSLTSSMFSIFMYYVMVHGKFSKMTSMNFLIKEKVVLTLIMLMAPTVLLSLKPLMLLIS
uniref:NADH-ubiquinone oxidoreductase chain 4 n=1 Tax=Aleurochiton aceris TaxID=266942 RepID=Q697H4_ALEAC|nr:NADH dehydrogenase subunit 4 [Aleurochiton aceris]